MYWYCQSVYVYINGIHLLSSVSNKKKKKKSVHSTCGSMHTAFSCAYCGVLSPRLCSIQPVFSQTSQPSLCYLQLAFNSWVSVSVSLFTKVAEKSISACPYRHLFPFPSFPHRPPPVCVFLVFSALFRRPQKADRKTRFRLGGGGWPQTMSSIQ